MIDSGYTKEVNYDPIKKITTIDSEHISKDQAIQRKGRAGRTSEGICYRIFSEEDFHAMIPRNKPEIMKTNTDLVLLKILGLGSRLDEFDLIDNLDYKMVQ